MADFKFAALRKKMARPLGLMILLIICGVSLNILGAKSAGALRLPVYLDTFGTVVVAVLGGYIPGILTGFASNLINGFSDVTNTYYASINALIGVASAYFAEKGYWKKLYKTILTVPALALIGGGLGGIMTWCLYEQSFDPSVKLAVLFYGCGLSPFWAQIIAAFILDIADKVLIVLMAFVAIHFIPDEWRHTLFYEGWKQRPLTEEEKSAAMRSETRLTSLRTTLIVLIVAAILSEAVGATIVCAVLYHNNMIEEQKHLGLGIANLVASTIDPEMVDTYIEEGLNAEDYIPTEKRLQAIRTSSPNIEYIYVYKILPDGCHVVFDLDTDEVEGSEPGEVVDFDESFAEFIPALLAGEEIEPLVSNDTYGWLLTAYVPVYSDQGECKCYACVDISMDRLTINEIGFLSREASLFIGIFLLILFLGVWIADYNIILPINTMTLAAGAFAYDSEEAGSESVNRFRRLDIHTGDEIESLYGAVAKTMTDTQHYVEDIHAKNNTITKMQNGLILVLADMVESRDQCTGDHVRKTAAYVKLIMEHMKKLGIYDGMITDEFCLDVINSAPLHDVGKIQVSDTLLNKPGKLTDEEFEIMKTHTIAGKKIIEQAIDTVGGESGYLSEAKNLAAFHHERWDGKGYPNGLAGEEIPLSARIMAVADVYDALVSQRSYKPPFSFEKAEEIIREGAGTQFDPEVVRAFLDGADEAREIAGSFLEK